MKKTALFLTVLLMSFMWPGTSQTILNEGFEFGYVPPALWNAIEDSPTSDWYGWVSSDMAHSGTHSASIDYAIDGHDSYLITPQLTISGHKLLSFWYAANFPDYMNPEDMDNGGTTLTVEISTTTVSASQFIPVAVVPAATSQNVFYNFVLDLESYNGQTIYIGFHVEDNYGTGIFLDDIMVYDMPSCFPPSNLTVSNIQANNATLSWTDTLEGNSYMVQYMMNGESWINADSLTVDNFTTTLTGLQATSTYLVRVKSLCGENESSAWSEPISFNTICEAITLTGDEVWEEGFETTMDGEILPLPICWDASVTSSNFGAPFISKGWLPACHSGEASLELRGDYGETNVVAMPQFSNHLNSLRLSFYANTSAQTISSSGTFQVGYMTDADDPSTFTVIETVSARTECLSRINSIAFGPFDFLPAMNNQGRIAFRFTSNNANISWNIDDIEVTLIPECAEPTLLQSSNVSSNSASVYWSVQEDQLYDILYWVTGTTDTVLIEGVYLDNGPYTLDSLTPSTSYTWMSRAVCDDGTYSNSIVNGQFTTPGAAIELPYSQTFAADEAEITEIEISGSGPNQWVIGAATGLPDSDEPGATSRSLYISDDQGYSNTYNSNGHSYAYATINVQFPDEPFEYHLEFDFKVNGESNGYYYWDYFRVFLLDGGDMVPTSGEPGGVALFDPLTHYQNWGHADVVIPYEPGSSKKIVFFWRNDDWIEVQPPVAVDNITITGNSCGRPSQLVATDVQSNEVTLHWHENGVSTSWNIYYRPSGSDEAMQHVVVNDSTTYTLTGLFANTDYFCFITANCEDGQESNHSNPFVFRTLCSEDGITALPYIETFNSTVNLGGNAYDVFVPCWSRLQSDWNHRAYVNTSDFNSNCLDFHYTPNCYSIAILPVFSSEIPINSLMVNFDIRKQDLSAGPLEVGAMTDPNEAGTFVPIATIMPSVSEMWENHTVYCNEYNGSGQYLAFRVNNSGNNSVVIDNLTVSGLPQCMPVSNIVVSDISENNATITWNGNDDENFDVFIEGPSNHTYSVTGNSLLVTGLMPSSSYSVTVQRICSEDSSLMSNPVGFLTACGLITITEETPWVESFDNYIGTTDNLPLSNCWTTPVSYQPVNTTVTYPAVLNLATAAHSGTNSLEMLGNTNLLVLPEFSNDINTLRVSFWGNTEAVISGNAGHLEVGYISDVTHLQTFTSVATIEPTAYGRTGHDSPNADFYGPFDLYTANPLPGTRIAVRYINSTPYFACNLDDFEVSLIPDCPSPVKNSVTANITNNAVIISWADNYTDHNNWTVHYKPSNAGDDEWETVEANGVMSATLTELASNTSYDVYVTTNCGGESGTDATNIMHFITPQVAVELPYTTDFSESSDWVLNNGSYTNHWVIRSPTPTGTAKALFITSNGLSPSYDETKMSMVAAEKLFKVGNVPEIQISFDVKVGGEFASNLDYDFMKLFLAPSEMEFELPTDYYGSHWATANYSNYAYNFTDYQSYSGGNPSAPYNFSLTGGDIVHIDAVMPNPYTNPTSESVAKLVFSWTNDGSAYTEKPAAVIYNLYVASVSCTQPQNLTVQNIGNTSVDISWDAITDQEAWILEYKESSATTWISIPVNTNSYHLTGLSALTNYNVRVAVDCGEGATSIWSTTNFQTRLCEAENQCVYSLFMTDTYGDGWNNASLSIIQNGHEIGNYTVSSGYTNQVNFVLCDSTTTSLIWNKGLYDSECTFYIYDASENQIFVTSSLTQLSGLIHTFTPNCFPEVPVCEPPFGTLISDVTDSTAYIDWIINGQEMSWVLQYSTDTLTDWITEELPYNMFFFENLMPSTTYFVRVKSICGPNSESVWSEVMSFTTGPDTSIVEPFIITNIAMDITDTSATLNGAIVTFGNQPIIARGFEWRVTDGGNPQIVFQEEPVPTLTYSLTGLTPGTHYTYRAFVTTVNTTTYGNEKSFTTLTGAPCERPVDLTVTDTAAESITISWTDISGADHWMIRYRTQEGEWSSVTTSQNPYTIDNLTEHTSYEIQVRALCEDNYSYWSPSIYVTTKGVGINEYLFNSITLYPNPTKEVINVICTMNNVQFDVTALEVYDVYGKLVNNFNMIENPTRINVSGLTAGMYFVRVTTDKGTVTKPFVKN